MKRLIAVIFVTLSAAGSLGGACGPGLGPPPPDDCPSPKSTSFAMLEVGPELLPNRAFEAWGPDDTTYITQGAQGGHMVAFALHLSADAPECMVQKTTVVQDGQVVAEQSSSVKTYDAGDGTRKTKTAYAVLDIDSPPVGAKLTVTTKAGGKTATANLTVVADRNLLESIKVLTQAPHVGVPVDLQLSSRLAPAGSSITVTSESSDPSVLSVSPPPYIYDDTTTFQGSAYSAGTATVTVKLNNQMVSVPVTVMP